MTFVPEFENEPVVAIVGASYANSYSPLFDDSLNNGAYLDMTDALTREGYLVMTEAQGAATSYDQPDVGLRGIQVQVDRVLANIPLWPDRVKVVVFTLLNDCLHSVQCTHEGMDLYLNRVKGAVSTIQAAGKEAIVNALPEWESLHLKEAVAFYGKDYAISEIDYVVLQEKQREIFESMEGVQFIYPWEKAGVFPDGLHPGSGQMKKGADVVVKAIKRVL